MTKLWGTNIKYMHPSFFEVGLKKDCRHCTISRATHWEFKEKAWNLEPTTENPEAAFWRQLRGNVPYEHTNINYEYLDKKRLSLAWVIFRPRSSANYRNILNEPILTRCWLEFLLFSGSFVIELCEGVMTCY